MGAAPTVRCPACGASHPQGQLCGCGDRDRPSACKRGYDRRWRKRRLRWLAESPERNLCAECLKRGVVRESGPVDHIVPHRGDRRLFDDDGNLQGLCVECHGRKTRSGQ